MLLRKRTIVIMIGNRTAILTPRNDDMAESARILRGRVGAVSCGSTQLERTRLGWVFTKRENNNGDDDRIFTANGRRC